MSQPYRWRTIQSLPLSISFMDSCSCRRPSTINWCSAFAFSCQWGQWNWLVWTNSVGKIMARSIEPIQSENHVYSSLIYLGQFWQHWTAFHSLNEIYIRMMTHSCEKKIVIQIIFTTLLLLLISELLGGVFQVKNDFKKMFKIWKKKKNELLHLMEFEELRWEFLSSFKKEK